MNSLSHQNGNDQEVTLVDLAAILVQRRLVFTLTFLIAVVLGVVYTMSAPEKYEYVSLVHVAEDSEGDPIEPVSSTLVALETYWFPEIESGYREETGKFLPVRVAVSSPRHTSLVRIESLAPRDRADLVREVHADLIQRLEMVQGERLENRRDGIQRQLDAVDQVIEELRSGEGRGQALAEAVNQRIELEGRLEGLSAPVVVASGRESVRKVEPNVPLMIIVSVVLGFVLAIICAFLAEFSGLVSSRLREQTQ